MMTNLRMNYRFCRVAVLACLPMLGSVVSCPAADELSWPPITSQTRPWVWWWWHGSAVDQTNITHELQRFHDAGLGGVQVTTIYGVKGAEARDINYLSPDWMRLMGFTVDQAQRQGMGVTMTLGSGWCFGGPTVSNEDANASAVVKTFDVKAGEKLISKINRTGLQALMAFSADKNSIDLSGKINADGSVDWTAPDGSWMVYAITQKPSGQKVKRAAPGGEGWMLNPLYPQAMRDWLPWFDSALADYHGSRPMAVFQDSYEYKTDWSPDFFEQFEKLRGYRLQNELPALFGSVSDDHAARVKYDYRRTISEVMAGQSEPIWIDWAHKNGFETIYQAHGTPGNWLDLYADADMPETEMFHNDRSILVSKFASSAAHVAGRSLTGAETGTWLKEHFTETLADLKYLADDMFLAGVNRIFYHGACYSPDDAPWPGWLFYASTEMNPRNSIWHDVRALNDYVARVQSVLQSGKPDNDVLLYWPVADFWSSPQGLVQPMGVSQGNWFEGQQIGKTAHELWNHGCAFDYISDAQLLRAKVTDGKIETAGGDYKMIFVPKCEYIPLATFKQLLALAKKGATIIFEDQLPADIAGWKDVKSQQAEFQEQKSIVASLFNNNVSHASFGQGVVYCGSIDSWGSILPRETMSDIGLSYIRRVSDGGHDYFIANRSGKDFDGWVTLGRTMESAVLLDPSTGKAGVAAKNSEGQIRLQLVAGGSVILRTFADEKVQGMVWNYLETNGAAAEINGTWNISFVSGNESLPRNTQINKLASWTTFADTNAQAFGGTAKYETTFEAPAGANANGFVLNLGDVRQSAHVVLNGKDYGTLIAPPYRVVVDNLKPTGNQLEVEVTSVDANRIRDLDRRGVKWKYFKDINVVNVNYRPFDASQWPLADCGLLGPVTLTPVANEPGKD